MYNNNDDDNAAASLEGHVTKIFMLVLSSNAKLLQSLVYNNIIEIVNIYNMINSVTDSVIVFC